MSAKQVLIGTISGIVAGAIVGLILAPQSGEETRQQIADSAKDLKDKLSKLSSKSLEELNELQGIFKSEVAGLSEDIRHKVLNIIKHAKSSRQEIVSDVSEA